VDERVRGRTAAPMRPFMLGNLQVDPAANEIREGERTITVRRKVMEALTLLAANADRVVTKEELLDELWQAQPASEESVTQIISELRRALGDSDRPQRLIQTVPKRGYRLVAPARPVPPQAPPVVLPVARLSAGWAAIWPAIAPRERWLMLVTVALVAQTILRLVIHGHH
jgi:DNA-binding winged helix-turn-helix (wHTH) protein